MTPGDFLRSVWPSTGYYCVAHPFTIPDTNKTTFSQKVFSSVSEAVSYVLQVKNSKDCFFAVFSLAQPEVFDPNKTDYKTGEKGAKAVRVQSNMAASRAFFFDIDIKIEDGCYHTREDAIAALTRFIKDTQLPWPMLVSSGGGFHVYWLVEDAIAAADWAQPALQLKNLAKAHGLKVDPSRTTDTASVLRVAGTLNWKDRSSPTSVDVIKPAAPSPNDVFLRALSDALIRAGGDPTTTPKPRTPAAPGLGSNMEREFDGPPADLKDVGDACAQLRELLKTRGNVPQSAWYHGILNTVKYTVSGSNDGRALAHLFSQGHPEYSREETDAKLDQLEANVGAPARCQTIREHSPWGESLCEGCIFRNDPSVPNPIVASRRNAQAAAPQLNFQAIGAPAINVTIPDPPAPFKRLKGGGIAAIVPVGDDEEKVEVIYPYDLYPAKRLINPLTNTEQHLWVVTLPRQGASEFLLDADALYDQRKFVTAIANHGIFPHRSYLQRMQEYMTAYISELQRLVDADVQASHLGWSEDFSKFVLPAHVLHRDGSATPSALSLGAERVSEQIHSKGTVERQVDLLRFYATPEYVENQFFILCGLGAPLMHMTGYHGVIVNASGDAGASKSTSLYTAASFWGAPDLYPINGTNSGATVRARNERVTTLANLPICVDEITHMPVKDAQDLAMGITQPGHRLRLDTSGVERRSSGGSKSTILLSTANNSLHNLLSVDNAAGTAGSMRVFEIQFTAKTVHKKHQADDYMRELRENYGHLGPRFIAYVVQNYAAVTQRVQYWQREIDQRAMIQPSERFWSAPPATGITAGEIANNLGLLHFDTDYILKWVVDVQIPRMRGIVITEYASPLSVLTDYIESINAHIVVTSKPAATSFGTGNISIMHHEPRGALLAHYDTDIGTMSILKTGFKNYCQRIGANYLRIVDELNAPHPAVGLVGDETRIVLEKSVRRTLGAGTSYAKTQSWCFVVNMRHPQVCEHPKLRAVESTFAANDTAASA